MPKCVAQRLRMSQKCGWEKWEGWAFEGASRESTMCRREVLTLLRHKSFSSITTKPKGPFFRPLLSFWPFCGRAREMVRCMSDWLTVVICKMLTRLALNISSKVWPFLAHSFLAFGLYQQLLIELTNRARSRVVFPVQCNNLKQSFKGWWSRSLNWSWSLIFQKDQWSFNSSVTGPQCPSLGTGG